MSASLVGSEMCIRDRLRLCPRAWGALGTGTPLRWRKKSRKKGQLLGGQICLLYTSDAADDM
eukprot:13446749-Alexandrium_andersonii.AAC.1